MNPEDADIQPEPLPAGMVFVRYFSPRRVIMLRRSGYSMTDIVNCIHNVPELDPKASTLNRNKTKRTKEQACETMLSMRGQRGCEKVAIFAESKGIRKRLPKHSVEAFSRLSNAQYFHRVIGKIQRGEFELTAPDDWDQMISATGTTRVALKVPRDLEPWFRQSLEKAGVNDIPTFPEFLLRNLDIAQHWGLNPMTGHPWGYVQPATTARSKSRSRARVSRANQNQPAIPQAPIATGQSFSRPPPAQTKQASPTMNLSRKRTAGDFTQSDSNKKRKLADAAGETYEQAQPVQQADQQPVQQQNEFSSAQLHNLLNDFDDLPFDPYSHHFIDQQQYFGGAELQNMNEDSAQEVQYGVDLSYEVLERSLRNIEESLYKPLPGQSVHDHQYFGGLDLDCDFSGGGVDGSEYDPGYASASMASPDSPDSFTDSSQEVDSNQMMALSDPNISFDD